MNSRVFFVSGIDTNIGKSFATGILARSFMRSGFRVITQKVIQTGCTGVSEDIMVHRSLMGIAMTDEDKRGITCPYIFSYPASPHLAAQMDGKIIVPERIHEATDVLRERYDVVLLEGAGGLLVPITEELTTIDFINRYRYPVVLVTSGRLGSINHTLLSLQACEQRGIVVSSVIYNLYPKEDELISNDAFNYIKRYLEHKHPNARLLRLPDTGTDNDFHFDL